MHGRAFGRAHITHKDEQVDHLLFRFRSLGGGAVDRSVASKVSLPVRMVRAWRLARATAGAFGRVNAGGDFIVGPRFSVTRGRSFSAGDRVSVGADFRCMANAEIGDDVMISSAVAFIGDDHPFSDPGKTIQQQEPRPPACIRVEGNNLIGYGSILMGSITIGRGAIVGAGSLVTSDLPPDMVCAGRPARPIRKRYEDS